jgi:small-conductance mechanosensitive channel
MEILSELHSSVRIMIIIGAAVGVHLASITLRKAGEKLLGFSSKPHFKKFRSVFSLVISFLIFLLYFTATGFILKELGLSLKTYLASASVIALALGFGSQGLVQDVVTSLTLLFSDLLNMGDLVEIAGESGVVRKIGMRFTVLENSLGANVYVPNRTITKVLTYSKGYSRCLVDVRLPEKEETADQMENRVMSLVESTAQQYPAISIYPPSLEGRFKTTAGTRYLRVKFRLWPGRGDLLETVFKQELIERMKAVNPSFAEWMVSVSWKIE